jgi:hypothetical protein
MKDPIGDYCDYLDKEMTIMGLLTAFSIAVPSLVLDRLAGAKESEQFNLYLLWDTQRPLILAGSMSFFLAALAFYLQRSHLAYYFGQLRLSLTPAAYAGSPTKSLLEEADSWSAWVRYNTAFALLIPGFVFYGIAIFIPFIDRIGALVCIAAISTLVIGYSSLNYLVKSRGKFEDHPWKIFFGIRVKK